MNYYAVLFSVSSGEFHLMEAESLTGIAEKVAAVPVDNTTKGVVFRGDRVHITKGPWRYLVEGDKRVPLFNEPKPGEIDTSPNLGPSTSDEKLTPYQKLIATLAEAESDA